MSNFHQTSPDSAFTKRWICSRATPDGRITVANRRLIINSAGRRDESVLTTDEDVRRCLRHHFRIDFDTSVDLSKLAAYDGGQTTTA